MASSTVGEVGKPKRGPELPESDDVGPRQLDQTRCQKPGATSIGSAKEAGLPEVAGRLLRQAIFPTEAVSKRPSRGKRKLPRSSYRPKAASGG
jgi:hypothetical protein